MHPSRLAFLVLLYGAVALGAGATQAASFDCSKARAKLNRMICADPALSALDSQVWETYGARIARASVMQYAHLRERHATWRRQRGLYERTIDTLKDEYQRHLDWLNHPLLPLEGRYEHDDDLSVQVDVDTAAPSLLALHGSVRTSGLVRYRFAWTPPAPGEALNAVLPSGGASEARPGLTVADRMVVFAPAFIGSPPSPVQDCRIEILFDADELSLITHGACGAPLGGRYRKRAYATGWGMP